MYHRGKEKLLFTIISKSIYKNYDKMLNNRKKCVKMSSKKKKKSSWIHTSFNNNVNSRLFTKNTINKISIRKPHKQSNRLKVWLLEGKE